MIGWNATAHLLREMQNTWDLPISQFTYFSRILFARADWQRGVPDTGIRWIFFLPEKSTPPWYSSASRPRELRATLREGYLTFVRVFFLCFVEEKVSTKSSNAFCCVSFFPFVNNLLRLFLFPLVFQELLKSSLVWQRWCSCLVGSRCSCAQN